jgi:hypothetical protein
MVVEEHFEAANGRWSILYLRIFTWSPKITKPIIFFECGLADPSQQCKRASNSIQDLPPRWILTIFKLKFGEGNLFSPAMTSTIEENNSVESLLEPLLKKVTPVVSSRMLCCSTQFLLHLLITLPINFLYHLLPDNQTKTSVTFGCGYLRDSRPYERMQRKMQ